MAINFEIFPDLRIVLTVIAGSIDDKMCFDNARLLADHPEFEPAFDQIIDMTAITSNNLTEDGIKEISGFTPFSPDSRRAFIVAENSLLTHTQYFSSLPNINSDNIFITHSRDKAYKWLLG